MNQAAQQFSVEQWVIYERPKDYPQGYVVRRWIIARGRTYFDHDAFTAPTLTEARRLLPTGLTNLGRMDGDDPVIREVWM